MRASMALVASALTLAACGSVKSAAPLTDSSAAARRGALGPAGEGSSEAAPRRDAEGDSDDPTGAYYDPDDNEILTFGHDADAAETRAVATLVKRYYAAVVAGDLSS